MIGVVDYGVANLGSIINMLHKVGAQAEAISSPDTIEQVEKIILPGVGSFDHGIEALSQLDLIEALKRRVLNDGVPLLGICLGMQLLGKASEEGKQEGLGLIDGKCVRFDFNNDKTLKVPHMGWNKLISKRENRIFCGLEERARFYFVHSYHFRCVDSSDILATANYGIEFTAMVQRGNVWGVQFHPEKSHRFGLTLLRNFVEQ